MSVSEIELTIGSTRGTTERVMGEVGTTAETGVTKEQLATILARPMYNAAELGYVIDGLVIDEEEN